MGLAEIIESAICFSEPADALLQRTELVRTAVRGAGALGCVVAVSGGVDSSVALALACAAVGAERVVAIALPDRDTSGYSTTLAQELSHRYHVADFRVVDIDPAVALLGCFKTRQQVAEEVFGIYSPESDRLRTEFSFDIETPGSLPVFYLVRVNEGGSERKRLQASPHRRLVAAMNIKQRVRMLETYRAAEELNYIVLGTSNRQEILQGFFVKNGDGTGDVFPLHDCYKTQVRQLARAAGVPAVISERTSTTDTYSAPQTQESFYFLWDERRMDFLLAGYDMGADCDSVGAAVGVSPLAVRRTYDLLERRRMAARRLLAGIQIETTLGS
jgi:NAD+ synthase